MVLSLDGAKELLARARQKSQDSGRQAICQSWHEGSLVQCLWRHSTASISPPA